LSFFDEADEPRTETRVPPGSPPRRRRPSGTGRRPPRDQQSVQTRRAVLAVVLLVVVILIALGVHSCQVSATESALKDYTNHVSSLITQSNATGKQLFGQLTPSGGQGNGTAVQTQINGTLGQAQNELQSAESYGAPDAVKNANANFVLALKMRADGIRNIAGEIQPALGNQTSQSAVNTIAGEMARFYGSDVLYKDYAAPAIAGALHAAGIAVGGNGETIAGGQFVPSVQWLLPSYIAGQLHVAASGGTGPASSHSHKLTQVAIGSNTMVTGVTNHTPATPPAVFTLTFTNANGASAGSNVTCEVTVAGTGISSTATATTPSAGQTGTCQVTLSSSPPLGLHQVTAVVQSSSGEGANKTNSESFPLDFQ
jgi:hypothetical protein